MLSSQCSYASHTAPCYRPFSRSGSILDRLRTFKRRGSASSMPSSICASQPQQPLWRRIKPDETALPADEFQELAAPFARIGRHSATYYNSGQGKNPQNSQRHYMPVSVSKWNSFPTTAEAGWIGHPSPAPAKTAVISDNEAGSSSEFNFRVTGPLSEVMDPGGQLLWRKTGGRLPNWVPYKKLQESLSAKKQMESFKNPSCKAPAG